MKTNLLTRVRKHFTNNDIPVHTQRHNMIAWVKSIRMLGDKWLLAKPMECRK